MTTSLSCTLHPSTLLISTNGSDTCLDCMIYEFSDKESTLLHSSRVLLTRYFIEVWLCYWDLQHDCAKAKLTNYIFAKALNHKRVQDYLQVHRDLIIHLLSGIVRGSQKKRFWSQSSLTWFFLAAENAGTNESFLEELSQLVQFAIVSIHRLRLESSTCYQIMM